jgi:hypothetical protein
MPLTDFVIAGDIQVRELHNSYMSVLARQGLFIGIFVFSIWFLAVKFSLKNILNKNPIGSSSVIGFSIFCSFYIVNVLIFAMAEDAFEKPMFAVPFYFMFGILLRLQRNEVK